MSTEKETPSKLDRKEIINVSRLIYTAGSKVSFRRHQTSRAIIPGEPQILTANASPNFYYVSLSDSSEVVLPLTPKKD